MAKIENIKTDQIEFSVFGAAKVFILFEKQYDKSMINYIQENSQDVNAYANILLLGHKSWAKLKEVEEVIKDVDYILDRMDINEMASSVMQMLGLKVEPVSEDSDKKK